MLWLLHKPLKGINVLNVATFELIILNIQVNHHQAKLTKLWEKNASSHP